MTRLQARNGQGEVSQVFLAIEVFPYLWQGDHETMPFGVFGGKICHDRFQVLPLV